MEGRQLAAGRDEQEPAACSSAPRNRLLGLFGEAPDKPWVRACLSKLSKQRWLRIGFPVLKVGEDALKPRRTPEGGSCAVQLGKRLN